MTRHYETLRNTRFLTKQDVDPPIQVTIDRIVDEIVGTDRNPTDEKQVLYFKELDKGLVLNWTNGERIASITGQVDMDQWSGLSIVLYFNPDVDFQGKVVGGIRVRTVPAPTDPGTNKPDNDIPFKSD